MKVVIALSIFLLSISNIGAQNGDCKCCSENNSEFDFWLGSWEVFNRDGKLVGYNKIEKVQGGCVVKENWRASNGSYTAISNNFYNIKTEEWEQIWLDNQGGNLYLKGHRIGNKMILKSDVLKNQKGEEYYNKITWTHNEEGTVRQLWEVVTNKTNVEIAFDGLYKKKAFRK